MKQSKQKLTENEETIHLKKIDNPIGVCGSGLGLRVKVLFQVNCNKCIDYAISKRLNEISVLEQAKQNKDCVNNIIKVNGNNYWIRL